MWFSIARALGIILASITVTVFSVDRAHAFSSVAMDDFCTFYNAMIQPPDEFSCAGGTAFNWAWSGDYDISSMGEEAPNYAAGICDDLINACWDTCDSTAYRAWAINIVNYNAYPNCQYDIECIESWANPSCQQGETGTFTCSCQYMNVCAPC